MSYVVCGVVSCGVMWCGLYCSVERWLMGERGELFEGEYFVWFWQSVVVDYVEVFLVEDEVRSGGAFSEDIALFEWR